MYFQRIGGRSVAHTNIHPKQSPASHAFTFVAATKEKVLPG